MTPIADPRRASNLRLVTEVVVTLASVVAVALWAFLPPRLPAVPDTLAATPTAAPSAANAIDRTAWTVALWRPLVDAPAAAAPGVPLKLFSILHRDGEPIAALDPDDGSGLVYARVGEQVRGVTVTRIEDDAVVLASGSGSTRVELPR